MNDKTDKNEPGRFLGEGVSFRAKLIGVLEVPEARGDRMCQEALSDLKIAIRAAGEHKQRIQVHVAIDGLRLRDDKTGDSLYHHPVHKISFIAQDMTDSRAFGYIFGSPDTGHRFFGIKTDKAASQVVIAMRDLFQVVFELKKKEVELAKQQLEGKAGASALHKHPAPPALALADKMKSMMSSEAAAKPDSGAEGGVAELVDLEQELCSLRRGLTQVEELTPSADPFGDSFIVPTSQSQKALLPPPPSGASTRGRNTPAAARTVFSPNKQTALPFDLAPTSDFETPPTSLVDNNVPSEPPVSVGSVAPSSSISYDVFTDLDPLGTGKSKPYVDKKLFFQELKNPPKKVLKDLQISEPEKDYMPTTTMTSLTRHSGGSVAVKQSFFGVGFFASDPFEETDPFDNSDPFSESKEDPFTSMNEFPKRREAMRREMKRREERESLERENAKNMFNGPLQVSLPPEPAPRSPRLQRQASSESGGSCHWRETLSPPPPLPPKKSVDVRPPPRPPAEPEAEPEPAPPLPRPARKKEPMADRRTKPRLSSAATNSSEDEYLSPAPPPLPAARRFDITLSQLLTCNMDELANRLRVPVGTLSSMTLPQLTDYIRSYLAADNERARIYADIANFGRNKHGIQISTYRAASPEQMEIPRLKSEQTETPKLVKPPKITAPPPSEFKPQFEDNFTPPPESDAFEANFDDFDKKANASYDRYAAFREIQEEELKAMSTLDPLETKQDSDEKEELTAIDNIMRANLDLETEEKESKSPLKSLDELTIDSFNMFRKSVSPKTTPIDAKIEDIKCVMKSLQIETSRRSVSPRDNGHVEAKQEDNSDRYAALREITITEPQEEFESLPPDLPKERKKSDEKSDGFDNSDFFDCIDNSSLSLTHVEDAFRKSPIVKEREEKSDLPRSSPQPDKKEVRLEPPVRCAPQPLRLSTASLSDGCSGSSPDTKDKVLVGGCTSRWAVLGGARSPPSSDSSPRARRPSRHARTHPNIQTSSSSRDVSPWDEDLPPVSRLPRPPSHHRDRDRESRHNSSGSRECLDSGSGREKDKIRDKRDKRDLSRDSRESGRDPRDSGSGRDRRDSKERDHREHRRDRRSRERDSDTWERERTYSREQYRDSRSRDRLKDYREKDRDRHRKPRHSYDDEEDYSDGCGSGRSSSRDRWDRFRREAERNYGSLGWREGRRREPRPRDSADDPRYSCTLGWTAARRSARRDEREPRDEREARRRPRREEARRRDYRFSNDFSPRDEDDKKRSYPPPADCASSRFNMYPGAAPLSSRFAFEEDVPSTASPVSSSLRARDGDSPATRFRFDSDSISPRSMFEDDFTALSTPRGRTASIAEEEECEVPPLRSKPPAPHKDIKKSESINIFTREADPFANDAFFACTGSDRAARRENWPGDFQAFENS